MQTGRKGHFGLNTDKAALHAESKGAALKAVLGYILGPSVQGAAQFYEQFPLNPPV